MEVYLRSPAKSVYRKMAANEGSFLRKHKKSLEGKRECYRLMTKDFSPIINYPQWKCKQLFQLSVLDNAGYGYILKEGVVVVDRRKKKETAQ